MFLPNCFRSRCRGAFSLLELLLVVAVMLVLMALAFPLFSSLQDRKKSMRCIQNLRSVGAALFAYAADNRQMLPPRSLGLYRSESEAAPPPKIERPWVNRLVLKGYAENRDIFYCPSFTPYSDHLSPNPIPDENRIRTYGMRTWTPPGTNGWGTHMTIIEEHKSLALIEEPSDFFLVVDTVWSHASYRSQGYGISPGMATEQFIHLRHSGQANALFADGHVASKPESYFADLHLPHRQQRYSGGKSQAFGVTSQMQF